MPGFRVLVSLACLLGTAAVAYEGHEHRRIGERAFIDAFNVVRRTASADAPLPPLPWKFTPGGRWVTCESENKKVGGCDSLGEGNRVLIWVGNRTNGDPGDWATFGELVELYGDHRDTVDKMLATPPDALAAIKKAAEATGHTFDRPYEELNYLGLAARNVSHFGSAAVLSYYLYHQTAIGYVYLAVESGDTRKLWEALHYEALAVHSLTDLYAPGHLFVDRVGAVDVIQGAQGITDGKTTVARLSSLAQWFRGSAAGIYDKLGPKRHDEFNAAGANVKNLTISSHWWTYGDGKYLSMPTTGREGPYAAAMKSLVNLLSAYKFMLAGKAGKTPKTPKQQWAERIASPATYEALREVPVMFEKNKATAGIFNTPCRENFCDFPMRKVIEKLLKK